MEHPDLQGDEPSREEVTEMLESTDVLTLGRPADEVRRRLFGERVHYGQTTAPGEIDGSGYAEVHLEYIGEVVPEQVDAFVGEVDDDVELHEEAWSEGVPTDYAVGYGERDAREVADELLGLREAAGDGDLRCVEMAPVGRTTAYRDLAAAATARLLFDEVHVRLDRRKAGDKITQTALEFGVDDVGFVDGEDEVGDVERLADDLGFTAVERGGDGRW